MGSGPRSSGPRSSGPRSSGAGVPVGGGAACATSTAPGRGGSDWPGPTAAGSSPGTAGERASSRARGLSGERHCGATGRHAPHREPRAADTFPALTGRRSSREPESGPVGHAPEAQWTDPVRGVPNRRRQSPPGRRSQPERTHPRRAHSLSAGHVITVCGRPPGRLSEPRSTLRPCNPRCLSPPRSRAPSALRAGRRQVTPWLVTPWLVTLDALRGDPDRTPDGL